MKANKTIPTDASVASYIEGIDSPKKQADARQIIALIQAATNESPVMWGSSIIGFGSMHYKSAAGREGNWMIVGFSARKQALTLYGLLDHNSSADGLDKLGTYTTGKGCLYIKKLEDIDTDVLRRLVSSAYKNPGLTE